MKNPIPQDAIPPEIREAVASLPAVVPAAQAAAFLNIDQRTLRRWARSGRIRVLKTHPAGSGRVSVLRSEVARVLAGMIQPVAFR